MKLNNLLRLAAISCIICLASGCKNGSVAEYGYKNLYPNADKIVFDDFSIVELSKDVPDDVLKKAVEDQDYAVKGIA